MVSADTVVDSVKTESQIVVMFEDFRDLWDARITASEGSHSKPFSVAGWLMKMCLAERPTGRVALQIACCKDSTLPLKVTRCHLKIDNSIERIAERLVYYQPLWCEWEKRPTTASSDYYCLTIATTEKLLALADENMGLLTVVLTIVAEPPYGLPALSSSLPLAIASYRALWSKLCLITLKGEGECEIQVPRQIVCAHWAVFAAALNSEMVEGKTYVIDIADAPQQALKDLCDFFFERGLP